MGNYLVSINDIPPDGKEFDLDDQQIWLGPLEEFKMDCRVVKPLDMKVFVQHADEGCLIRGRLTGTVVLPCNRCAEDAVAEIDSHIDEYEEVPVDESAEAKSEAGNDGHIVFERHVPMLNLAEIAWEQFMLSLPVNPLCKPDCKGLCQHCGANLNMGACGCQDENGDPRMALLRNIKIEKK